MRQLTSPLPDPVAFILAILRQSIGAPIALDGNADLVARREGDIEQRDLVRGGCGRRAGG